MKGSKGYGNIDKLLKEDPSLKSDQLPSNTKEEAKGCEEQQEVTMGEIMKELKLVRRQNTITHCLLSMLIVVTAVWQLSEVSVLLTVKKKISHPFQSIKSFVFGALCGRGGLHNFLHTPLIPQLEVNAPIGLPELPQVDLLCSPPVDDNTKD